LATPLPATWREDVLRTVGAPITRANLDFLGTWQRYEGGSTHNAANYNPLNTTRGGPGAAGAINSVGVDAYRDWRSGLGATVGTLRSGRYGDIVSALMSGDPRRSAPVAGLSTWLSGSANSPAGAKYAAKVLGSSAVSGATQKNTATQQAAAGAFQQSLAGVAHTFETKQQMASGLLQMARNTLAGRFEDNGQILYGLGQLQRRLQSSAATPTLPTAEVTPSGAAAGGLVDTSKGWRGTHVTDGLDWNNGARTAGDIMANPGSVVGAPENGTVIRWGSAQGGEALYFRGASGKTYWMGHIDQRLPVGARVQIGQPVARVSSDHARPHLHIDVKS